MKSGIKILNFFGSLVTCRCEMHHRFTTKILLILQILIPTVYAMGPGTWTEASGKYSDPAKGDKICAYRRVP